jgi:hypothetical protein
MLAMNSASVVARGFKLTNNTAQNGIGGLFIDGGTLDLANATLASNSAEELWLMNNVAFTLANSIAWNDGSGAAIGSYSQQSLPAQVHHSIVDSNRLTASGFPTSDPLFDGSSWGNHNVALGSAADDGGDPASADPDGSRCDMGAHQIVGN